MVRTIWLALVCLGIISSIAAVRLVSSEFSSVAVGAGNPSIQPMAIMSLIVETETVDKADRLPVNIELASFEPATVAPVKIDPVVPSVRPPVSEKIISRHWHDPNAFVRSGKPAAIRTSREARTNSKRRGVAEFECSSGKPRKRSPGCSVASTFSAKRAPTAR